MEGLIRNCGGRVRGNELEICSRDFRIHVTIRGNSIGVHSVGDIHVSLPLLCLFGVGWGVSLMSRLLSWIPYYRNMLRKILDFRVSGESLGFIGSKPYRYIEQV